MVEVPKIVLTGGPRAGKTTALCFLQEKLSDFGFYPLLIPETPTMLIKSGVTPVGEFFSVRDFQRLVFKQVMFLEDLYMQAARKINHPKPMVICDRGLMDGEAYAGPDLFKEIVQSFGLDIPKVRDERYNGVVHLRSSAFMGNEFYLQRDNPARMEDAEEAKIRDEKTLEAWIGHPHLRVVDSSLDFKSKMRKLLAVVCRLIGFPVPLEIERKFLVERLTPAFYDIPKQFIEIEQVYIHDPVYPLAKEVRIRKRMQGASSVYYQTLKEYVGLGVRAEKEFWITSEEYEKKKNELQEAGTMIIRKNRCCFVYANQYFELDSFIHPISNLMVLEIELTEEGEGINIPSCIEIKRDVTTDPNFSNRNLAQIH
ncbi:MAG: AAA family ATPase [bacterium]|nr:AAA family ATPase [bacterium]